MSNYVITIARGFGSGGKQIGRKLAAQLGIPCYESRLPEIARDFETEQLRWPTLQRALKQVPERDVACDRFVCDDAMFQVQSRIIRELARKSSCVIIGKCANYLLRDRTNVLSVFVGAPESSCVAAVQEKLGLSLEEANEAIQKVDGYRSAYYTYYTGGQRWDDPLLYDIMLNTANMDYDDAARTILHAARVKFGDDIVA